MRRALATVAALAAAFPAAAAAAPPRAQTLSSGWEVRTQAAAPAPPNPRRRSRASPRTSPADGQLGARRAGVAGDRRAGAP